MEDKNNTGSLKKPEPRLNISISEDRMTAVISAPPSGLNEPVTTEDIESALAELNIVFGIDKQAIEKVVTQVAAKTTPWVDVTVAGGNTPAHGEDGIIKIKFGSETSFQWSKV